MSHDFELFSVTHVAVVALFAAAWLVVIRGALKLRGTRRLIILERLFALVTFAAWLANEVWALTGNRFDPAYSLPIQICDVVALLVPVVFLWPRRFLLALLYYWGVGLSAWGIVTPELARGPATLGFWIFWSHHALIVGAAIYMIVVHKYRPTWRGYGIAVVSALVYLAIVMPLNIACDYNYGFVGDMLPAQRTLLDVLGPWPWRVVVMVLGLFAEMALLQVPWAVARRRRRGT